MFPDKKYLVRYKYYLSPGVSGQVKFSEESRIQKASSPEQAINKAMKNLYKEFENARSFTLIDIHKI